MIGKLMNTFIPNLIYHTVKWIVPTSIREQDNVVVKTEDVDHGYAATPPSDELCSTYISEKKYIAGWDTSYNEVTKDLNITAIIKDKLQVCWIIETNTVKIEYLIPGEKPTAPDITLKNPDHSTFLEWLCNGKSYTISPVTSTINIVASIAYDWIFSKANTKEALDNPLTCIFTQFTKSSKFSIYQLFDDGSSTSSGTNEGLLQGQYIQSLSIDNDKILSVSTGETADYITITGKKTGTANITIKARNTTHVLQVNIVMSTLYTINWVVAGVVVKTEDVLQGNAAVPPNKEEYENYLNAGAEVYAWDKEYDNIQSNMNITAKLKSDWYFALTSSRNEISSFNAVYPSSSYKNYLIAIYDPNLGVYIKASDIDSYSLSDSTILDINKTGSYLGLIGKKNGKVNLTVTYSQYTHTIPINMTYYEPQNISLSTTKGAVDFSGTESLLLYDEQGLQVGSLPSTVLESSGISCNISKSDDINISDVIIDGRTIRPGSASIVLAHTDYFGNQIESKKSYVAQNDSNVALTNSSGSEIYSTTLAVGGSIDVVFKAYTTINGDSKWYDSSKMPWNASISDTSQAVRTSTTEYTPSGRVYNYKVASVTYPNSTTIRITGLQAGVSIIRFNTNGGSPYKYAYLVVKVQ